MFRISFFMECASEEEACSVVDKTMNALDSHIHSYSVFEKGPYDKIDGWFVIRCDLEAEKIDSEKAKAITSLISNSWEWMGDGCACDSTVVNKPSTVFLFPEIKFVDCWFKDLDKRFLETSE